MKAIVQHTYGPPEILEFRDIDAPVAGDDEVLVQVQAAGVDPGVWHQMSGLPYLMRFIGFGLRAPKVPVRGRDVAGRVAAVGKNVTSLRPGDEVFGICEGSFAEYACAPADRFVPKPANLTFEQAAAVPISGITALQSLRDCGKVQQGQRVLIIGAGGGIGSFAVQLAKAFGADVTGVCSTSKLDLVRGLGADDVIDYTREDFTDGTHRYDIVLDTAGNRPLTRLRRTLAPRGTLVIVGSEGAGNWLGGIDRVLRATLLSPFVGQQLRGQLTKERMDDLRTLRELIEDGRLMPLLDRTFPLSEAADAVRYVHNGHSRGKVVVTV